jgi:hypothetical protein
VTKRLILVVFALTVGACSPSPGVPTPTAVNSLAPAESLPQGEVALPTEVPVILPSGETEVCAGIGLSAVLHGDPHDRHVAWLVNSLGTRIDVTWPAGYRARFVPTLEVLDAAGAVVLREGDPVTEGCVTSDPHVLHLQPTLN